MKVRVAPFLPQLFSLLLVLSSCAPSLPDGVLGEKVMEDVLYDYHIAQAMADAVGDSSDYRCYAYVQKVFEKHHITEAQFDSSMLWYTANAGKLYAIYQRIDGRLSAQAENIASTQGDFDYHSLSAQGDTANIWSGNQMYVLLQASPDNRFAFSLQADSTFHDGDRFVLRLDTRFVSRDGNHHAIAALFVTHQGDSVVSYTRDIQGDRSVEISVDARRNLHIQSVSGFVYYPTTANPDGTPRRLFLVNPRLIRIHR